MFPRGILKIGDHLKTPQAKRNFNKEVFGLIAPKYNFITRALSFGRDIFWKKDLIAALPSFQAPLCLDLATGTGDIAFLLAERFPDASITGIDITDAMLEQADAANRCAQVRFENQDMGHLNFPDETFDIISGGYALRNAADLQGTLVEIYRVLKKNGVCVLLDFSKPPGNVPQRVEYWLLNMWTGLWGLLLHGNPDIYRYIAESLQIYPDRKVLRRILTRNHFMVTTSSLYFFGIIELLVLNKGDAPTLNVPRAWA